MSEPENFLARWSRRKQEAEHEADQPGHPAGEENAPATEPVTEPRASAGLETSAGKTASDDNLPSEVDLSSLPPVESIGVGTDIRAFLQKGVPLELSRAALRRAWSADPTIRDFIGIAENQWDFATGADLPGFGPLEASDDVRRMVAELFQRSVKPPIAEPPYPAPDLPPEEQARSAQDADTLAAPTQEETLRDSSKSEPQELQPAIASMTPSDPAHREDDNVAPQQNAKHPDSDEPTKRSHGGALPQ
jgi:hypothetical protein